MTDRNSNEGTDDLEENVHDQLPSVEDYKASAGFRRAGAFKPDPSGSQPKNEYKTQIPDTAILGSTADLADLGNQSSLPHVDEYKHFHRDRSRHGFWKICGICSFLTLLLVTVLSIALPRDNFTWWLKDSDRYFSIQQYLINSGISNSSDLFEANSPQHIAAKWIANKDGLQLPVPTSSSTTAAHVTFVERYVLAVFYYATGGPEWTHQLNFLNDNHVCTWSEPFFTESEDSALDVNNGDYVTLGVHGCKLVGEDLVPMSIFLPDNNLVGSLPDEIQFLDNLEILSVQFNGDLGGPLPRALASMEKLRHLGLHWCSFTGTIPSWIGDLTLMKYLGLGNNLFTGTVPTEMGSLEDLELLGLDDNNLSANIELFHSLKAIKSLYLEDNQLTGTLSDALMAGWPDLEELDLSSNQLTGTLPENFFNHDNNLQVLDLGNNGFEGSLPAPGWNNFNIKVLALQDNKFNSKVPDNIAMFKSVIHLDLSGNDFSSTLPATFAQLTQLEYLFLGNNPYDSVALPTFLIDLVNLRDLSFKNSRLVSNIPDYLSYLTNLEFLDLHYNQLTGTIPNVLGELTSLKHLLLKSNRLTGSMPDAFGILSNLNVLLLEQNRLIGDFNAICNSVGFELQSFVSDCKSEVKCSCCDLCCSDDDTTCNAGDWDGNIDPIWEYGFRRGRYSYDMGSHVLIVP